MILLTSFLIVTTFDSQINSLIAFLILIHFLEINIYLILQTS